MTSPNPFESDASSRVQAAIDAVSRGEVVILVDDEDRENEGDLVMAADKVTPVMINFMARHGRGLICLPMATEVIDKLDLPMMVRDNASPYGTAFTVSIEARTGVSTGISAADRARTIQVAVDPDACAADLVSPGHIFPLRARSGGVLVRAGQTEGSVDLARLAGCSPAGVICEIMNEDGTMSRLPELIEFAEQHSLCMLSVADLISWRMQRETLVHCVASAPVQTEGMGEVTAKLYRNHANDLQYLALIKGEPQPEIPTLVRVTSSNVWADALQAFRCDGGPLLSQALRSLGSVEHAVLLYVLRPFDGDAVLRSLMAVASDVVGEIPAERVAADPYPTAIRDYGLGAQVLRQLGVAKIRLITNSDRRLPGVEGYGIEVVERVAVAADGAAAGADLAVLPGGLS
jgi:3,4-dihydroxy 2-butanone 4-phosphate synthase/GTP cyclohydrolase II